MRALAIAVCLLLGGCMTSADMSARGQAMYDEIMSFSQADLDTAIALANYNKDQPAVQCWSAINDFISAVKARPRVTVGAFTSVQVFMDLTNPNGTLNTACEAQRAAVKARVQLLIAKVATFAASVGL